MQISCADGTFDPRCDSHICTSWTIGMWNRFDMKITRSQTTVANCTQTHTFGCHLQIVILDTGDWQAFIYNLLILFKVLSSHLQSSLLFHFFSYSVRLNFCSSQEFTDFSARTEKLHCAMIEWCLHDLSALHHQIIVRSKSNNKRIQLASTQKILRYLQSYHTL